MRVSFWHEKQKKVDKNIGQISIKLEKYYGRYKVWRE
jgi:hypothetical protein